MVGDKKYSGDNVKAGFYDSIKTLRSKDTNHNPSKIIDFKEDYKNILYLCKDKVDLPSISLEKSTSILHQLKSSVQDIFNITTLHYINAGESGLQHFNFLLNCIIENVNLASVEELNTMYALLLHKGHGKVHTLDKSYRTISTCPLLSKAMDLYIRELHLSKWKLQEAPTQYQGEGSSHELAGLMITEVIRHSCFTLKQPIYLLFLDAKSAFDRVVPELLIRNLFLSGMNGNSLVYLNNRLTNRATYLEWNKTIMGPIKDELGLEQGGLNSSDMYKLYNNELLISAQKSEQGVDLGGRLIVSATGLADDTVLSANSLSCLSYILHLTKNYCKKYMVTLCPEKTRLLRITGNQVTDLELFNPITISGKNIQFSNQAEHVGIVRSIDGNTPNLLNRISSHKKALGATLSVGLARRQRSNPIVGMNIEKLYGTPVLISGLASLVMTGTDMEVVESHYKCTY